MSDNTKKKAGKAKDVYFEQAIDWDEQRRLSLIKRSILNRRLAWGNGIWAAVATATVAVLVPLHSFIPVVVRVNELTGAYDVSVTWRNINMQDPVWEKTKITDLTRYVNAREGFTRGEAERNYAQAYLMSCGQERANWDNFYRPETNPNAPIKTYGPNDEDRVAIKNITFLPTDREDIQTAQVRFDKTRVRGMAVPVTTRYIATIEFSYNKENVPTEIGQMQYNAFGLCVNRWRRDQEGESREETQGMPQGNEGTPEVIGTTKPQQPAQQQGGQAVAPAQVGRVASGVITPANIGTQGGQQ